MTANGGMAGLIASVLLGGPLATADARAQEKEPGWLGGQIYQENDSLIAGDERYTQGLKFSIVRRTPPRVVTKFGDWLAGKLWSRDSSFNPGFAAVFGQNMYTPSIITARQPYPGDRGFAGVLYAGAQAQFTEEGQTRRHTFEADLGLTGWGSLAGPAQSALHVLRFRRIPKGWDDAPDHVVVGTYYRFEQRLGCSSERPCHADLTFGGLGALGNLQTAAGVHGAARIGFGLTGFPVTAIPNALARPHRSTFEVGAILGWEGRFVPYNGLLRPSLEVPGQEFSPERLVSDTRYGAYARFKDVRFTALRVERSAEFEVTGTPRSGQRFLSVSVSYEPLDVPIPRERGPLWRDWHFQLGLGANLLGPERVQGGRQPGPAGRVGIAKGFAWDLLAGFELAGSVAANSPATSEAFTHNDTFLIHRSVTLGWAPRFARKHLIVRAGPTLLGQLAKLEATDNHRVDGRPAEDRSAQYQHGDRWGWIAGIDYTLPLERHLFLGAGVTYSRLRFPERVPSLAGTSFLAGMLCIDVRP